MCDSRQPTEGADSPEGAAIEEQLCGDCGHSEGNHRVDHTACHGTYKSGECSCTGYYPRGRAEPPPGECSFCHNTIPLPEPSLDVMKRALPPDTYDDRSQWTQDSLARRILNELARLRGTGEST